MIPFSAIPFGVQFLIITFLVLGGAMCYMAIRIRCEERKFRGGFMSWNIEKKGTPAEVLAGVKAAPDAHYMPETLPLLIEELLSKAKGGVSLSTNGHVFEGIGEVHLTIAAAPAEVATDSAAEAPKLESGEASA